MERRHSGAFSSSELQQRSPRATNERIQDAHMLSKLQTHVDELSSENDRLRAQLETFHDKLQKREQEIGRLSKLTEHVGGASDNVRRQDQRYAEQAAQDATDLHVEQLQAQVDLLNDQVAKYEARLREAHDEIRRNDGLAETLRCVVCRVVSSLSSSIVGKADEQSECCHYYERQESERTE